MKKLLPIIYFLFLIHYLSAQVSFNEQIGELPFTYYGIEEGLPQEEIISIFQDSDGFMWFGTYTGVAKYNGREMEIFDESNGLISNSVFDIKQDLAGNIIFVTLSGVSFFDGKIFDNYFKGIQLNECYVDAKNQKWFYGDAGIFLLDEKNNEIKFSENNNFKELFISKIEGIKNDEIIFFSSENGFFKYQNNEIKKLFNEKIATFTIISDSIIYAEIENQTHRLIINIEGDIIENKAIEITNTLIKKIIKDQFDNVFFISIYSIFQLTPKNEIIEYSDKTGMLGYEIFTVYTDNEKNIWFGLGGGIQKLSSLALRNIYPELTDGYVNSIREDKLGRIWFIVNNQIAFISDDLYFFSENFPSENEIYGVDILNNDNILIISDLGLYEVDVNSLFVINTNIFQNFSMSYIETSLITSDNQIFVLGGEEGVIYYFENFFAEPKEISNEYTSNIFQMIEFEGKAIGANNSGLVYFNGQTFEPYINTDYATWPLCIYNNELYFGLENGFSICQNSEYEYIANDLIFGNINEIEPDNEKNHLWIGKNDGVYYFNIETKEIQYIINQEFGLTANEIAIEGLLLDSRNILWIGTFHGISSFDKNKIDKNIEKIPFYIDLKLNGKKIDTLGTELKYFQNNIEFELTALSFRNEKITEYDFFLEGLENDYNKSTGLNHKTFYQNLYPGEYTFKCRYKLQNGNWSDYKDIKFEIMHPFWKEWWFIGICIILTFFTIFILFKWRTRIIRKQNLRLERIVQERTKEITEQKNQIFEQKEELLQQKEEIQSIADNLKESYDLLSQKNEEITEIANNLSVANNEISTQNKKITDSIVYAQRIQNALLPLKENINRFFPNNFIFFKPRDIVSGDFYWFKNLNYRGENLCFYVLADCTGHGVPGALMSMLGISFLNEIIKQEDVKNSSDVLVRLREYVKMALKQTGKEGETKDGMDMAFCIINQRIKQICFAGANLPLYFIKKEQDNVIVFKGDRMPIGIYFNEKNHFERKIFNYEEGDCIYMSSDGYIDQPGGKSERKFLSKKFQQLLCSIHNFDIQKQEQIIEDTHYEWIFKGQQKEIKQIDDITVIGIKF